MEIRRVVRPSRTELIRTEIWGEHFVWWDEPLEGTAGGLRELLASSPNERNVQKYLEVNPGLLVRILGGGHGRWAIPQKRLGSEHVTDFVLGERHSGGYEWLAVELESPKAKMFNKNGDPSAALTHAIRQIQDWRRWLKSNQNYASRPRTDNGLELPDIDGNVAGLVIIGRRDAINPLTNGLRRQMVQDLRIQIHSYDYLLGLGRGPDILTLTEMGEC